MKSFLKKKIIYPKPNFFILYLSLSKSIRSPSFIHTGISPVSLRKITRASLRRIKPITVIIMRVATSNRKAGTAGAFTSLTIAFVTSALTKVVLRMSRDLLRHPPNWKYAVCAHLSALRLDKANKYLRYLTLYMLQFCFRRTHSFLISIKHENSVDESVSSASKHSVSW